MLPNTTAHSAGTWAWEQGLPVLSGSVRTLHGSPVMKNTWECLPRSLFHKVKGPAPRPRLRARPTAVSSPVISWRAPLLSLGRVPAREPPALSGPWQCSDLFRGLGGLSGFLEGLPAVGTAVETTLVAYPLKTLGPTRLSTLLAVQGASSLPQPSPFSSPAPGLSPDRHTDVVT